jgi:hypothetical protein
MTKGPSPLLGYNTNVRHKGRVFHIQTEDSGVLRPHVITHLFADGGRILKSARTTYGELVSAPDMAAQVKRIMQEQHKAMFVALRDGQFDAMFEPDPSQTVAPTRPTETRPSLRPPAPTPGAGADGIAQRSLVASSPGVAAVVGERSEDGGADTGSDTPVDPIDRAGLGVEQGAPKFADGLLSEKSLDEVILAYLSEDLAVRDR